MKQMTLATAKGFEVHGRATRKAEFLARMEALVPWSHFCAVIEPHYPKAGNGRPPVGLERMLRMYLVANWFNLGDEACEDALYDIPAFRDFCRIDLGRERAPGSLGAQEQHLVDGVRRTRLQQREQRAHGLADARRRLGRLRRDQPPLGHGRSEDQRAR